MLNLCTDFWTGDEVEALTDQKRKDIKAVVAQWESNDFDSIGFSYKPVTKDFEQELKDIKQGKVFERKQEAQSFIQNQIFLGLIAVKHHRRIDTKK